MFHFRCPHCNAKLEAEDDWAGMEAACPKCSQTITIVPETTPEKLKIQLTPITSPTLTEAQHPVSTQSHPPKNPSASNKFPFICPSCGTLTDLDSWHSSIAWLIKLEMPQRAVNLLLGYR